MQRAPTLSTLATLAFIAHCGGNSGTTSDSGSTPDASDVATADRTVTPDGAGNTDAGSLPDRADVASPRDTGTGSTDSGTGTPDAGDTLAGRYPCDRGLAADPAVIWAEDFEEGSVAAVTARYDSANNPPGMTLVNDAPGTCGGASMRLVSGVAHNATDLYKSIAPHDEVYVRWYAKYEPGIQWHHAGMWFGGYNPAEPYPNPQAGYRPNGDDRFSVAIEPAWNIGQADTRFDTYDYWMGMHSWMSPPPTGNDGSSYYGNSVIHSQSFTLDEGNWVCLEVHLKLNTDLSSSAGALLEVWKNDALVAHFDAQSPAGCWIRDKFCPPGADGNECTDYPSLCTQPYVPLDQQWRSTASLPVNAFWPQNYITDGPDGALQFDQMVVATQRVGCVR